MRDESINTDVHQMVFKVLMVTVVSVPACDNPHTTVQHKITCLISSISGPTFALGQTRGHSDSGYFIINIIVVSLVTL